jgi:hypothetical protein
VPEEGRMTTQQFEKEIDLLYASGYKSFRNNSKNGATSMAYQRRVSDPINGRTKYFITIYVYDYTKYNLPEDYGMEVSICFDSRTTEPETVKPTFWGTIGYTTQKEVEELVETLWVAYGSFYYDYIEE